MQNDKRITMIQKYLIFGLFAIGLLISNCASSKATREGYNIFNKYGFTFEYPQTFSIIETGLFQGQATNKSGVVIAFHKYSEEYEIFTVVWQDTPESLFGLDEETFIETMFEDGLILMSQMIEDVNLIDNTDKIWWGDMLSSTKEGHYFLYQYLNINLSSISENKYINLVIGCWYCNKDQRLYYTSYSNVSVRPQFVHTEYNRFNDSIVCH